MTQKIHPLCDLFPPMSAEERAETLASIRDDGLTNPIWRWGNQIVDGKNRLSICEELGVKPDFREWRPSARATSQADQEAELWAFIRGQNLARRHLTTSQRAMIAAEVANLSANRPKKTAGIPAVTQSEAAKEMDVSRDSVQTAAAVKRNGSDKLVDAVKAGTVTLNDAAKLSKEPKRTQNAAVKAKEAGKAKTATAAAKPLKAEAKFDDSIIDQHLGRLIRSLDERAKSLDQFRSVGHSRCLDAANELASEWRKWRASK